MLSTLFMDVSVTDPLLCFFLVDGGRSKNTAISVFTQDWTNGKNLNKIAQVIRDLGIMAELIYKPDIYSLLGIYRSGVFRVPPSIYFYKKKN